MPTPKNIKLYNQVKNEVYKSNPTHSAYRSAQIVNFTRKEVDRMRVIRKKETSPNGLKNVGGIRT